MHKCLLESFRSCVPTYDRKVRKNIYESVFHRWLITIYCQLGFSVHGISRQGYWSGLSFPSPGVFPTQGLNPGLLNCRQTLYHMSHQGNPTFFPESKTKVHDL